MPILVRLPGGGIAQFPDGMSDAEIDARIAAIGQESQPEPPDFGNVEGGSASTESSFAPGTDIPLSPDERVVGNIYSDRQGNPRRWGDGAWMTADESRETTFGEMAKGYALKVPQGLMGATRAVADVGNLAMNALGSGMTPEGERAFRNEFQRANDYYEQMKPAAFRAEQNAGIVERDGAGDIVGLRAPTAESVGGALIDTAAQIPAFIAGGAGLTNLAAAGLKNSPRLAAAIGYGGTNAALIAPTQRQDTIGEAEHLGMSPEGAREAGNSAGLMTAGLSAVTGGAGGLMSQIGGAGAGSFASALGRGFLAEAPFEGIEEAGQSAIGDIALGRRVNAADALDAGLLAGLTGGLPGSAIAGMEYAGRPVSPSIAPPPDDPRPTDLSPGTIAAGNAALTPPSIGYTAPTSFGYEAPTFPPAPVVTAGVTGPTAPAARRGELMADAILGEAKARSVEIVGGIPATPADIASDASIVEQFRNNQAQAPAIVPPAQQYPLGVPPEPTDDLNSLMSPDAWQSAAAALGLPESAVPSAPPPVRPATRPAPVAAPQNLSAPLDTQAASTAQPAEPAAQPYNEPTRGQANPLEAGRLDVPARPEPVAAPAAVSRDLAGAQAQALSLADELQSLRDGRREQTQAEGRQETQADETELERALVAATGIIYSADDVARAVAWADANGRPDISDAARARAEAELADAKATHEKFNNAATAKLLARAQEAFDRFLALTSASATEPAQPAKAAPADDLNALMQQDVAADEAPSENQTEGRRIREIAVDQLALSQDVPQFKSGASDATGVVEPLGGTFDRRGVGPIQVWKRLDGRHEVISGRHRLDLARRSGEKTIPAQVYDEAAGFDAAQAAGLDAELNIRDGQGKVKDYVQFFQQPAFDGDAGRQAADARGLLARATGKRAYTVASAGTPELIAAHSADRITDEAAVQVAQAAPNNEGLQNLGLKLLAEGRTISATVNILHAAKAVRGPKIESGDLFGFDDSAMLDYAAMGDVASREQRSLGERIAAIRGASKRPELARKEGVDVRDPAALDARLRELTTEKIRWDSWSSHSDLVARSRSEAGLDALPEQDAVSEPEPEVDPGQQGFVMEDRGASQAAPPSERQPQADVETGDLPAQDVSEYGETSPLQLGEERGATSPANGVASGRGAAPAIRNQLDMFVATRSDAAPDQGAGVVKVNRRRLSQAVGLAQIGQFRSGHAVVDSLEKAAHILAPLRKSAQEQFLALVLDDAGKPLGVIRHTVGTIDSSMVEPGVVFSAIAAIPGASRVVFAHNHPSGNLTPSSADRTVDLKLEHLLRGSGIESLGAIIVAPGSRQFSAYGNSSTALQPVNNIAAAGRTVAQVPSLERRLTKIGKPGTGAMSSPADAARYAEEQAAGKHPSGVILLNSRHEVIGTFGMSRKDMTPLRTDDLSTGIADLARRVHGANAAAAFVYGPDSLKAEMLNLTKAINALGVRALDRFVIDGDGKAKSLASTGTQPSMSDNEFYSMPEDGEASLDSIEALRAELESSPIGRSLLALEKAGALRIIHDPSKSWAGAWDGRKATLNAAQIPAGKGIGVALHELGVHAERDSLSGILGDAGFKALLATIDRWADSSDPATRDLAASVQRRVNNANTPAQHRDEERLAYAVELAANAGMESGGEIRAFLRRFAAYVKAWLSASKLGSALRARGLNFDLTPQDVAQLAAYAVARQARAVTPSGAGRQAEAFSIAPQSETGVEFTNGQEALESRLAQWFASLRVGGSRPRTVAANAEGIGAVSRNAAGAAEQGDASRAEIREQSARLTERAKAEGFYWPDDSPIVAALNALPAEQKGGGAEHVAFIVGDGADRFVIRATDNGFFGHRSDISPAQYLARLDDYSETFPSMQTRLIGVSESAEVEGHAVIWTAQPYVRGKKFATQALLSEAMARHGWDEDGYPGVPRFKHRESGAIIEDAHTDNVFQDDNGDLYPFDVLVEAMPSVRYSMPDAPAFDPAKATAESVIREGRLLSLIDALKAAGADLSAIKQAVTDKSMSALTQAIDEAIPKLRPLRVTGIKNAVTDAERAAAGRDPILRDAIKSNEETLVAAMRELRDDPNAGEEVVARLSRGGEVSLADEGILLVYKTDLLNKRAAAADTLADTDASESRKDVARQAWADAEAKIAAVDVAASAIGSEAGRMLQFRQRMLREDFTFAALERKERARLERPLTQDESATIKAMADTIAEMQAKVDALQARISNAESEGAYEDMVKRMARPSKQRPTLASLRSKADAARARLAATQGVQSRRRQSGAVISPTVFYDYAVIGAYHILEGAATFTDWVVAMRADLGAKFDQLKADHRNIHRAAEKELDKPWSNGPTVAGVLEAIAPDDLTNRDVYRLAEAHVEAGVRGEAAVMAAVHASLSEQFEGITERDVRRMFSDYGNASFPSQDEAKAELRKLRSLVQMQESIDRITEGLAPLRSGPQRDAMTQEAREKRGQLNELLKTLAKDAKSPTQMRSYNDMRVRNLTNQIEDLEKQIQTGERPAAKARPQPSAEIQALMDRRDALTRERDLVDSGAKRNEAEKAALRKKIATIDAKMRGEGPTPKGPVQRVDDKEMTGLQAKIDALRARRDAMTREDSAREAAGNRIAMLMQRLAGMEKPATKVSTPDSAVVAELKRIRDELADDLRELEREPVDIEARYQATRGKQIERRIAELQERIAQGDFAARPRIPRALNEANQRAQYELDKVKEAFLRHQFLEMLKARSKWGKTLGFVGDSLNLSRALMTSLDLSGLLRQGGFVTFGHPVMGGKAFAQTLSALMSDRAEHAIMSEIKARPNARLYEKHKLALTGVGFDRGGLSKIEENYASRWIDKAALANEQDGSVRHRLRLLATMPVRASGRVYVSFMNRLRADAFDALAATMSKTGTPTEAEAQHIADFVNTATGRGKIPRSWDGLNTFAFAPRLVASRFSLATFTPIITAPTGRMKAQISKEYARALIGVGITMSLLAYGFGGDDENEWWESINFDPRSSDFMKLKFGETRIDPFMGLSQVIVFMARIATGETVTSAGEVRPLRSVRTWTDLRRQFDPSIPAHEVGEKGEMPFGARGLAEAVFSFVRSKANPATGATMNFVFGQNFIGEVTTVGGEAKNLLVPMSIPSIFEAMEDQGVPRGTALGLLSLFGMSLQVHTKDNEAQLKEFDKATDTMRDEVKERLSKLPQDQWQSALDGMHKEYEGVLAGVRLDTYKGDYTDAKGVFHEAGSPKVDKEGRPKLKYDRLSEGREDEYRANAGARPDEQAHHIIADNLVRRHKLMVHARNAGYDLNHAGNMIALPANPTGAKVGHNTDHPKYDAEVIGLLNENMKRLNREHGSLRNAPPAEVLDAVRKIEAEMRKRIEKRDVPIKDGRLAALGRPVSTA